MIVYKITNKHSGKGYVGKTISTLARRWSQHCCPSSTCYYLRRAIAKHGRGAFTIEVLAEARDVHELAELELALISEHNTWIPHGYNATIEATARKVSSKQAGICNRKPWSDEQRHNHREALVKSRGVPVVGINDQGQSLYLRCMKEGRQLGLNPNCINLCVLRPHKHKSHGGYVWRRLDELVA